MNLRQEEYGSRKYIQKDIVPFRGEWSVLSNLYVVEGGVPYAGKRYRSIEHGYKSTKASYHGKDEVALKAESVKGGKEVMNYVNRELKDEPVVEEWTVRKTSLMKELVKAKARVCRSYFYAIWEGRGKILAEATSDTEWGTGLPPDPTCNTQPEHWPGKNKLGEIMAEVMEELLEEARQVVGGDEFPNPECAYKIVSIITTDKDNEDIMSSSMLDPDEETLAPVIEEQGDEIEGEEEVEEETEDASNESTIRGNTTIVIGDSILVGAECDQDNTTIIAETGAQLTNIAPLLQKARKAAPQVDNVVIALGVNDIMKTESVGATNALCYKAISKTETVLPEARIFVSGVVPRKESDNPNCKAKACNEKIKEVNEYLRETAKVSENVFFLGNSNTFKKNAQTNFYKKGDSIHLNPTGKAELVRIITEGVEKKSKEVSKTPGKKRAHSHNTPPSAKRDAKVRKEVNE